VACRAVVGVQERAGQDTQWTAGETVAVAKRRGMYAALAARIAVDDTGVGGGVTDKMRAEGWMLSAENFGESPKWERVDGERFANRRTELWWGIREWIGTAALGGLPREWHDQLFADLTQIRYEYKGDQTIALESKKDLKKRIGRSPDFGDALALALAGTRIAKRFDMGEALRGRAKPDPRDDRDRPRRRGLGFDAGGFREAMDKADRLR